jgi:ABC-type uncharacterized transport system permease subunit
MLISGGLCGLAGVGEVAGIHHRMIEQYHHAMVTLLWQLHFWEEIASRCMFAAIYLQSLLLVQMACSSGLECCLNFLILQGIVLLFVIAGEVLRNRMEIARLKKESE